ncbi:MAG: HAD-IA family hydrolase [Thermoanaerobaculia bacterium]|nr:HAD-IA family hydrolase [Thermoanaerobaculia bacterium]
MYDIVTFDCYGTLIDWEQGFVRALLATGIGDPLDRPRIVELYHEIEPEIESEYRSYREVLTEVARRIGARLGLAVSEEQARMLPASLPAWPPFADTNRALERLSAAGVRLGILSNVDDDLLAATRKHFTADFDLIVTAQQVRSYKPGHAHFLEAREQIGGEARWLHAAQSHFHDVVPCRELGIPVAWINRKNERPGSDVLPERELRTLDALAEWLAP